MDAAPTVLKNSDFLKQAKDIVKSLGVVFGDIGTSPIYTLVTIFSNFLIEPTLPSILGIISLVIWTLVVLVMIQYAWLAMSLGKKGEGGTIVLKELLVPLLKSPQRVYIVTILSFVGIALFFGDGVITPAISILSAVEGILLVPGCSHFAHYTMFFACLITVLLFILQHRGTERISIAFGPIMSTWFISLAVFGLISLYQAPVLLMAVSPWYGLAFIVKHKFTGFLVLSGVILCATGGEALYADMGHLGRKPIRRAWYLVFVALILNYLGQGAFLLQNPHAAGRASVLYEMIMGHTSLTVYIVFLVLSLMATVIASQSLISGMFSVVYQGITTNIMPMFKVDYTSSKLRTQVYIRSVNWVLMFSVLFMILLFKHSNNLASAYGLAVTGTMSITGIMITWIFWLRHNMLKMLMSSGCTIVGLTFFLAGLSKFPEGGYWSVIIALCPLLLILTYTAGQRRLLNALQPTPVELFLENYETHYETATKLKGSALFFVRDIKMVPPYITQTMFKNNILYEDNILISVVTRDDPFGVIGFFKGNLAPGFRVFEIHMGYMEMLDIEKILRNAGIEPTVMFYGLEEIVTKNFVWKVFSFIKHISPSFVQFYKLPPEKLHGVITAIEL